MNNINKFTIQVILRLYFYVYIFISVISVPVVSLEFRTIHPVEHSEHKTKGSVISSNIIPCTDGRT